jgi:Tol biopolymer transport system component/DNA-binding winged helix-turn-helix (wHTH) protein
LRKSGLKLKLTGQPFQVLAILLERPGEVVTREELQKRLWPDTFVDVDHNLNTAINKIREVLGDSAESPRFVETLPRRGYRFIAPVEGPKLPATPAEESGSGVRRVSRIPTWIVPISILCVVILLLAASGLFIYQWRRAPTATAQRALTRLTFDEGLQIGATWSPDGRFIAYSSDRVGKFDIWVQQVGGGDPVKITKGPGQNWQPDWSPDGKYIAYRSEDGEGGLFVVPALGGEGRERRIATFGYRPRWSPNASQILFQTAQIYGLNRIYVVDFNGSAPREIAAEFLSRKPIGLWNRALSAVWHPDGKRVSIWMGQEEPSPSFWTLAIAGGTAVKSAVPPNLAKQFGDVAVAGVEQTWGEDSAFSWAPSGKAIYFERTSRGVRNIWKMTVDPETLEGIAIERLTTGPGVDTDPAISAGGKMAFTAETQHIRAWVFPFDANHGRLTGAGQALTPPAVKVTGGQSLTRDGSKLAFSGNRSGKWELWEKSLVDGRDLPIAADDYDCFAPQWSPDGTRLAYTRAKAGGSQLMVRSSQSRIEEPLTTFSQTSWFVTDWSRDGKWILASQSDDATSRAEIWLLPVARSPAAETASRKIAASPADGFWQAHFSPNGRWIAFEAVSGSPTSAKSTLYVVPASGGPRTRLLEGGQWDDKPRWSPDGNMIYFVSDRSGSFNVWGTHFDAIKGKAVGKPFPVTAFTTPVLMLPAPIDVVDLSITQDRLVLTLEDLSGSIWILDNVSP